MRKNLDNRSRSDNDRLHDLFRSRGCLATERWNWFQFGHTLQPANRGRGGGGGYPADGSPTVLRLKLPAFNRRNLSIDLFVSLRPQGHAAHGHPPFFFPVSSAVTLRPVTNGVDLALRAIWVTALLEPTGRSLTKRIDSESVGHPAVAGACFWRNHGDDAIVSIKAVYRAEQIATLDLTILLLSVNKVV